MIDHFEQWNAAGLQVGQNHFVYIYLPTYDGMRAWFIKKNLDDWPFYEVLAKELLIIFTNIWYPFKIEPWTNISNGMCGAGGLKRTKHKRLKKLQSGTTPSDKLIIHKFTSLIDSLTFSNVNNFLHEINNLQIFCYLRF